MAEEGKGKFSNLGMANLFFKASSTFRLVEGYKYVVKIGGGAKTSAVSIMKSADPGPINSNWLLRFDNPHKGANFPHLNIRHKYTGIKDPHIKLPPGSLTVAKYAGYFCKTLDYLHWLAIAHDTYRLGEAATKDYCNGTSENTVKCGLNIVCTWTGGIIGATVGGSIGTLFLPSVGTIIVAVAGSSTGVLYGRSLSDWINKSLKNEN